MVADSGLMLVTLPKLGTVGRISDTLFYNTTVRIQCIDGTINPAEHVQVSTAQQTPWTPLGPPRTSCDIAL